MKSAPASLVRRFEGTRRIASWGHYVLLGSSAAILIFAPLAYGAVHSWAYFGLGLIISVIIVPLLIIGLFWALWAPEKLAWLSRPPLWWLVPLGVIFLSVQLIPCPQDLIKLVSPQAFHLRALGNGYGLAAQAPLSLNSYATYLEALKMWPALLFFYLLLYTVQSSQEIKGLVWLILGVALFETLYGFWNFHSGLIWGWKNPFGGSSLHGTFINRNHLANYLSLAICLGLGLFLGLKEKAPRLAKNLRGRSRIKAWSQPEYLESHVRLCILLLILVVLGVGLIFTGSRGGMISLTVGTIFMGLLNCSTHRIGPWYLVLILVAVVSYGIWLEGVTSFHRLLEFFNVEQEGRYRTFWGAVNIWLQFPWFGCGLGAFGDLFYQLQPARMGLVRVAQTHNDWLQFLAETGIVGFTVLTLSWVYFFSLLYRKWRHHPHRFNQSLGLGGLTALLVGALHALGDFPYHVPALSYSYAGLAALTYLVLSGPHEVNAKADSDQRRPRPYLLVAGVLVGLLTVQLVYLHTVWRYWQAERAAPTERNSTRLPQRLEIDDFRRALALNPANSQYYLGLAEALETTEDSPEKPTPEIEALLQEAIFRAPALWSSRYQLAEFYLEDYQRNPGVYLARALKEFNAALELYPQSWFLNFRFGNILNWMEDNFPALIPLQFQGQGNYFLKKAVQLNPRLEKSGPGNRN